MSGKSFIFREEWLDIMDGLDDSQRDDVIRAAISYAFGYDENVKESLPLPERIAFNSIQGSIDRDQNKYNKVVEQRKAAGRKGGRPRTAEAEAEKANGFSENEEKAKKANGFSEKQKNPILILNPNLNLILNLSSYSSLSSFTSDKPTGEEQQEEELLKIFFFKNFNQPAAEIKKFISWNKIGGRDWDNWSYTERLSAAELWQQKTTGKPRMEERLLQFWKQIVETIQQAEAPHMVVMDALDDVIKFRNLQDNFYRLTCYGEFRDFIERNLDLFKPLFLALDPNISLSYEIINQR